MVLSVSDIEAERIEIAENLFRNELTVLERGQQYKRLKAFYEAEHPETKKGGYERNQTISADSALMPSFVADVATKTNKSPRAISEEVQVATNIPARVQTTIKDLPVADNKSDLLKLSRFNETAQNQIADVLQSGKAEKVLSGEL